MRSMLRVWVIVGWVLGSICQSDANAARIEIYDRTSGRTLPTYVYAGRTYVAGEPGHEYEIRIQSSAPHRVLAVTTVDGVNVVTGETGAVSQAGYVLDPFGSVRVEGWRKSLTHTAAFYFTSLANSYAARTGRPQHVGVIGVALFGEREPCCDAREPLSRNEARDRAAQAPAAAESDAQGAIRTERAAKATARLGTGHGRAEYSAAQYTEFERASSRPYEVIAIYYDSYRNLVTQGVIPTKPHLAQRPQPFPNSFVPDP